MSSAPNQLRIYLTPNDTVENAYLKNFARDAAASGATVVSAKRLWSLKEWRRAEQGKYLFANWIENLVLNNPKHRVRPWLAFPGKLLAARIQGVKIVWVRHNYRPHQVTVPNWVCKLLQRVLAGVSSLQVMHSQAAAHKHGCDYLPHPLYRPCGAEPSESFIADLNDVANRLAIVGQIRPSKGIDQALREWPKAVPLLIAGHSKSDEFLASLQQIARDRQLDVQFVHQLLSDAEFDHIVRTCRAIYLPNPSGTMIVSGVYYHAISLGTPVVMHASDFARETATLTDFSFELPSLTSLEDVLPKVDQLDRSSIVREAERLFGQKAFADAFQALLSDGPTCVEASGSHRPIMKCEGS